MSTLLLGISPRTEDDERQKMHALAGQGWGLRRIGRHLGREHSTVRRWLKRPPDYRIKYANRPRDHRGCFVRREEYLQRLTLLANAEQELKGLRDRVEAAQRGQHLSAQELLDVQQRQHRLEALLKTLRPVSGRVPLGHPVPPQASSFRGVEPQHVRRDALLRRIQRGRARSVSHPDGINLMCEFERLEDRLREAHTDAELAAIELKLGELESRAGFATS